MDIKNIPTDELIKDLQETIDDGLLCLAAIKLNVTEYSGGSVQERLDTNMRIKKKIEEELDRRMINAP